MIKIDINRYNKRYIEKHIEKYVGSVNAITSSWYDWIIEKVSVRRGSRKTNTTLFPYLRSGNLKKSIVKSPLKVGAIKVTKSGRANVRINLGINFRPVSSPTTEDYGELLNSSSYFAGATFFGWKDRAKDKLFADIHRRVR